ncbi:hypothetical protein OH76DRAFT_1442600 [Lentinus brumalis]|uniref:CENP-C homolog n=1 Tax=Lentinus brumalis TaxID=2498619 RepID=A0A371D321_9APHY|nr:hypothetical protein OH76DRAFT_1442600 [Polyporus brumalis]
MPAASARKSSLGASRRGPQKYIPYRADDFGHGKKTGIAVGIVDTTDEFEPFEKVMSQADQRTPFRPQGTRKKRGPKTPVPVREPSDDEENGEMSMDLDVTPHAPSAYFAHARVSTITSSMQRIGSSSRPVAHPSDVDFDDVPSPRASPSFTSKRSQANGNASRTSLPSRSRLSHSTIYRDDDDDDSDGDAGAPDYDYGDYGNDMDVDESPPPPPPQGSRTPRNGQTPRRTSFVHLDQEEDEHEEAQVEEEMEDYRRSPSEKARGKQPMAYQEEEQEMEPEIAQGFDDLDEQPMDEDPQEEEEAPPPKKGKKGREEKASKNSGKENDGAPRGRPRQKKVVLREATPDDPNQDGLRRSKRRRYSPLAWWRLEKVVYGRRENGQSLVPSIKEIHRIAQMPAKPLGARRRRRGQSRKKSRTVEPEAQQVLVYNPEEGWDEKTDSRCLVREYGDEDKEVERRVAFTANMVQPKPAAQGAFYFQKIFGDGDFLAAGQLIIPPGSTKPTKGTKDNTFVFYVIQGAVQFCVHKTNFVLSTGGMFMVPRGNIYYIQNICERDAKLFFAQARKMPEEAFREEEGEAESDHEQRSRSKSTAGQRRQSTGRASSDTVQGEEPEPKSKRRGTSTR